MLRPRLNADEVGGLDAWGHGRKFSVCGSQLGGFGAAFGGFGVGEDSFDFQAEKFILGDLDAEFAEGFAAGFPGTGFRVPLAEDGFFVESLGPADEVVGPLAILVFEQGGQYVLLSRATLGAHLGRREV